MKVRCCVCKSTHAACACAHVLVYAFMGAGVVFPALVSDFGTARLEWQILREHLWKAKQDGTSTTDVWLGIIEGTLGKAIPNVLLMAMLGLVVLLSSVPCEGGFSLMGILKTKLRNRLNIEHLCDLMQVARNSPDQNSESYREFLEEAYEHWISEVVRHMRLHMAIAGMRMCTCTHALSLTHTHPSG